MRKLVVSTRSVVSAWFPFVLVILFTAVPLNGHAENESILIANPHILETTISHSDVLNIFLGMKTTWEDGERINYTTLRSGSAHAHFLRIYLNMSPKQYQNHWKTMLFTGKGRVPKFYSSESQVVEFVSKNKNAVGYVSKGCPLHNVKLISVSR